jgi:hypothetical protein
MLFHRPVALQHSLYANVHQDRQEILLHRNKIISKALGSPARRRLNLRKGIRNHHYSLRQMPQFGSLAFQGLLNHWGRRFWNRQTSPNAASPPGRWSWRRFWLGWR